MCSATRAERHDSQTITRAGVWARRPVAERLHPQFAVIIVDGFIGKRSDFAIGLALIIERSNANRRRHCQQHLSYPASDRKNSTASSPA